MPPISSLSASVDVDAMALGVPEDVAPPMPNAGMRAISEICNQAATSAAALARAASGGLGNLVGGNYTPVAPPVQRITDMNNSGLAGLGALGMLGAAVGSQSGGGASIAPTAAASVPTESEPVAEAPAVPPDAPAAAPVDAPADAPAGDTGASTAETSSASETEEDAPRRRRHARVRTETHETDPSPVAAADDHAPEAEVPVAEAPVPVDESHRPPPESGFSLEMPDPSSMSPAETALLGEWLNPGADAPSADLGAHPVDPSLDPSVLPH